MIRKSLQFYFYFGTAVRYLQDARPGDRIADDPEGGRRVRTNLARLFADLADLNLRVTPGTTAAQRLRELLQQFGECGDDAVLSEIQHQTLETNVTELRASLEAELRSINAYSLTPGRENLEALHEDPAALFPPEIYAAVPEIAKRDLAAAARCMAFELPTAATFHLVRAVDAVLQAFYASPAAARRRTNHTELFERLDRIRTEYRNPLQQPLAEFSTDEAESLWFSAVDVIDRMIPSLAAARVRTGT